MSDHNFQFNRTNISSRGPRAKYHMYLHEYLKIMADNWKMYFDDPRNVLVSELLSAFDEFVTSSEMKNQSPEDAMYNIEKFYKGGKIDQPKKVTVNEKNRIHFGITRPNQHCLLFYPDYPSGNYREDGIKWKDLRVLPLSMYQENDKPLMEFYKEPGSNEISSLPYLK